MKHERHIPNNLKEGRTASLPFIMNNGHKKWSWPLSVCLMAWTLGIENPGCSGEAMMERESEQSLSHRVRKADFIFSGTVETIKYGMSDAVKEGQASLPLTYVTYHIDRNLKGRSAERSKVTLRFLGGQAPDGRYFEVSDMPQFKFGDQDLLFVQRNDEVSCPLVDCSSGRFRIIKSHVFGNDRQPVVNIQDGNFVYDHRRTGTTRALTVQRVVEEILKEVTRLFSAEDLKGLRPVPSAIPGEPVIAPDQPDLSPPDLGVPPPAVSNPMSEGDRVETEAFQRNQGNPVLKELPVR